MSTTNLEQELTRKTALLEAITDRNEVLRKEIITIQNLCDRALNIAEQRNAEVIALKSHLNTCLDIFQELADNTGNIAASMKIAKAIENIRRVT